MRMLNNRVGDPAEKQQQLTDPFSSPVCVVVLCGMQFFFTSKRNSYLVLKAKC